MNQKLSAIEANLAKEKNTKKTGNVLNTEQKEYNRSLVTRFRPFIGNGLQEDAKANMDSRFFILHQFMRKHCFDQNPKLMYNKSVALLYSLYYTHNKISYTDVPIRNMHEWTLAIYEENWKKINERKIATGVRTPQEKLVKKFKNGKATETSMAEVLGIIGEEQLTYLQQKELLKFGKDCYNMYSYLKSTCHVSANMGHLEGDMYIQEWFKMSSADPINEAPVFRTRTNKLKLILATIRNMKLPNNVVDILKNTFSGIKNTTLHASILTWWKKRISFIAMLTFRLANAEESAGIKRVFSNLNSLVSHFNNRAKNMDEKHINLDELKKSATQLQDMLSEIVSKLHCLLLKEDLTLKDTFEYCWIPEMITVEWSDVVVSENNTIIKGKSAFKEFAIRIHQILAITEKGANTQEEFDQCSLTAENVEISIILNNGYLRGSSKSFDTRIARPDFDWNFSDFTKNAKNMAQVVGKVFDVAFGGEGRNLQAKSMLVRYCEIHEKLREGVKPTDNELSDMRNICLQLFECLEDETESNAKRFKRNLTDDIITNVKVQTASGSNQTPMVNLNKTSMPTSSKNVSKSVQPPFNPTATNVQMDTNPQSAAKSHK